MMKKLNENLSEIFDVDPIDLESDLDSKSTNLVVSEPQENVSDVEIDYSVARNNIKNLIRKGDVAIDELMKVACESEHPRAYEVAATFIKTLADLNKDLLDIQKKKNDLSPTNKNTTLDGNQTPLIDKAVFIGSTKELIKLIKTNKED